MEGKTIASFEEAKDNKSITITFTDGSSVVIYARGHDSWLTIWRNAKW